MPSQVIQTTHAIRMTTVANSVTSLVDGYPRRERFEPRTPPVDLDIFCPFLDGFTGLTGPRDLSGWHARAGQYVSRSRRQRRVHMCGLWGRIRTRTAPDLPQKPRIPGISPRASRCGMKASRMSLRSTSSSPFTAEIPRPGREARTGDNFSSRSVLLAPVLARRRSSRRRVPSAGHGPARNSSRKLASLASSAGCGMLRGCGVAAGSGRGRVARVPARRLPGRPRRHGPSPRGGIPSVRLLQVEPCSPQDWDQEFRQRTTSWPTVHRCRRLTAWPTSAARLMRRTIPGTRPGPSVSWRPGRRWCPGPTPPCRLAPGPPTSHARRGWTARR